MQSEKIKLASAFASIKHQNQTRKNGSPYINHPIRVADKVSSYTEKNETLIISAVLHDTLEDTDTTYEEIIKTFGQEIGNIVLELTNDDEEKQKNGKEKYLSKKLVKMSDDSLTIKLCDRLDNVMDLVNSNDSKFIDKYINETINVLNYLIANRELQDTHMKIITDISLELGLLTKDNEEYLNKTLDLMAKLNIQVKTLEKKLKVW